ncbi:hypothetical protein L9F63_001412 [Diploptera punctata]|uniref:Ig-like domain-containing protein n=1 Tax=Diploptera punctata TaxID=6984 RepID=A0AAD8EJ11_DIPPU|nr:hypothetical protein L9F63_001412 [Diploptera punctata]
MLTSLMQRQLVSIVCCCSLVAAEYQDWLEHTSSPPIRVTRPAGKEVHLQCWFKSLQVTLQEDCCKFHDVLWEYKKCGTDSSLASCQSSSNDEWVTICGYYLEPCQETLVLNTSTEGISGMYRCSVSHRNKTSRNFKVTLTYELNVVGLKEAPPEFLSGHPANLTVFEGEPAVFQCRVHSKAPLSFFWFRQQNHSISNTSYITYFNDTYWLMKSSGERDLPNNTHLSKLILPQSSQFDSGFIFV